MWQAIVLMAAGTVLGLGAGYVQRWWAKSDTVEADKRASVRLLEQEERQEKRKLRRESVQPVRDFLVVARRYSAAVGQEQAVGRMYEEVGEIKETMKPEEFQEGLSLQSRSLPNMHEFGHSFLEALPATPTIEITTSLNQVWEAIVQASDSKGLARAAMAMKELQDLLDDYVTKV